MIRHYFSIVHTIIFLLLILLPINLWGQQDRPKVGLVLSGGGAKGFAHVGVIRELEKYNIPIDYIGGTSIGAIVGGLYSIGYSADELEEVLLTQDWEALFINKPERLYLPFFEKEENRRYLFSMQLKEGRLSIPNYAIKNNGIIKMFTDLTVGYHDVDDFNDLPTPFLCIAVDFLTGKEVVLNSGFLAHAMGASMAIPGVFPSMNTDSTVFVDGGVQNNFPVDHVRKMGADIIIGVDVGAGMRSKEELESFGAVIDQLTTMLGSVKYKVNKDDCEIFIKPDISGYSTADFTHDAAVGLLGAGSESGIAVADQLKELESQFEKYTFPKRSGYKAIENSDSKYVTRFNIKGSRLDDDDILGIMGISEETDLSCNLDDLQIGLDRLHGSMKFSTIQYKLKPDTLSGNYLLHLNLVEHSESRINVGAHYNTQDGVALLFNGTFSSLMFRNSRISTDLKLSEAPTFDIRYNVNRGSLPGLAVNYGFRGRVMMNYVDGVSLGEANVLKNYFEINTNSIVNDHFTIGLGARYEGFKVSGKKYDFPLENDKYNFFMYRFFFKGDTENKAYYPTHGLNYSFTADLITDNGYELDNDIPTIVSYLSMEQVFSPTDLWTFTPSFYAQLQFAHRTFPPIFFDTYVGGVVEPADIVSQVPFWGLKWAEFRANNIVMLAFENRFNVASKHYLYANVNAFAHTDMLASSTTSSDVEYRVGGAIGYSYNSLLGPVEIFFSLTNGGSPMSYINVGYYF